MMKNNADFLEEKIFHGVREILSRVLKVKPEEIVLDSKLQDELGIDSVDFWDVIANLEKKYKYRIKDKEAMTLVTVYDLVQKLKENVQI
jgi:acyl carrier protein